LDNFLACCGKSVEGIAKTIEISRVFSDGSPVKKEADRGLHNTRTNIRKKIFFTPEQKAVELRLNKRTNKHNFRPKTKKNVV